MLRLTDNAVAVIRGLTSDQPADAGLRIAADLVAGALTMSFEPAPGVADQVVDAGGVRLFLDSRAAVILDDKALHAAADAEGAVRFAVTDQE
jgi:Fe-S cluster assembly iron-binding protein IscA